MEKENNHKVRNFFIWFSVVFFFALLILIYVFQNNSDKTLTIDGKTYRYAQNYDITCWRNDDFLTRVAINIKPKQDINNLVVRVSFYTGNNQLLTQKERNMGNVQNGITETITFPLSEFSLSNLWEVNKFDIKVIGGTIELNKN